MIPAVKESEAEVGIGWQRCHSMVGGCLLRDMKGHTGTMSLGKGSIYSVATGQKLVAWSSTESELIGVHDVMPQIMWTSFFLQAQGLKIAENILYQDNMSSILLEKNGDQSSTRWTRHIDTRCFFVKDCVESGEIHIEHCPTLDVGRIFHKATPRCLVLQAKGSHHEH